MKNYKVILMDGLYNNSSKYIQRKEYEYLVSKLDILSNMMQEIETKLGLELVNFIFRVNYDGNVPESYHYQMFFKLTLDYTDKPFVEVLDHFNDIMGEKLLVKRVSLGLFVYITTFIPYPYTK